MINKLRPGIYDNNGVLEFDVPELLEYFGIEDTPENRDKMVDTVSRAVRDAAPHLYQRIVKNN